MGRGRSWRPNAQTSYCSWRPRSRATRAPGARSSTGTPRLVVSVVLRYRLSPAELQDVAQTVWLRLIEHLGDLREPRALPMWLITTAKREALRQAKASSRAPPDRPAGRRAGPRCFVIEDDQDADLVRDERQAALMEGFAALSPRQRELLMILSEDPPVPYAEISRRTGIPVGAIGPTRARAVERLRRTPSVQQLVAASAPSRARGQDHDRTIRRRRGARSRARPSCCGTRDPTSTRSRSGPRAPSPGGRSTRTC